jgi:hypothetical protein
MTVLSAQTPLSTCGASSSGICVISREQISPCQSLDEARQILMEKMKRKAEASVTAPAATSAVKD